MSGRRVAGGRERTGLEELVRVACSTDPLDLVIWLRRLALASRAAMVFRIECYGMHFLPDCKQSCSILYYAVPNNVRAVCIRII